MKDFWKSVQDAAGMGGQFHWVLLGCVAAALVLGALAPDARARLRGTVVLLLMSGAGMLVCGLILSNGALDDQAAGYRGIHYVAQLLLAVGVINLVGVLVFRVLLAGVRVKPAPILRDTLLGLAYVAAALVLLGRHGVNLTGVVATSAVVTAVIGFSLQDTLGNIMGGVALQMERSVAIGDWIRVGDVEGIVREIRWRQTSIETRNGDTVVVPNSSLMKSQVTVLGRREGKPRLHRAWVYFNVDFRQTPADVIEAVERAMRTEPVPAVSTDPPPDCILMEIKDSHGSYAVRYWTADLARIDPISSEVRTRIFVALRRAGMHLSIPAQNVYLTMEGRSLEERKRREERDKRVAALRDVAVLAPLTEEERAELADRLKPAPFRRGEWIVRQGTEARHLYILTRGQAEVQVSGPDGRTRAVGTLGPGDVCGEIALMSGEPRAATVTALTDVECLRLGKEPFREVLRRRPEVAEALSRLLAKRKLELDAMTAGLKADAMQDRMPETHGDLLVRLRRFLTLADD